MARETTDSLLDETPPPPRPGSTTRTTISVVDSGRVRRTTDLLATEEPMEIRLIVDGESQTVAITMRTPGADFELAAGFLHGEQLVKAPDDVRRISYCADRSIDAEQRYNIVNVELRPGMKPDLKPLDRYFYTSSACGVCGKASLEALRLGACPTITPGPEVPASTLTSLADQLRAKQGLFSSTGGLHAAALFDPSGSLIAAREDVGRHNAVDKLVGWALLQGRLPLSDSLLMVSGRASYEILQKAAVASIPIVCAISAPSSLAVDLAREFGMTLVGFLRGSRFNIYIGAERITGTLS
jgi:FdhD protein